LIDLHLPTGRIRCRIVKCRRITVHKTTNPITVRPPLSRQHLSIGTGCWWCWSQRCHRQPASGRPTRRRSRP